MAFQLDKLEYLHRSTEGGTSLASYTPDGDAFTEGTGGTPANNITEDGYWDGADVPLDGLIVFAVARTSTLSGGTALQQGTIRVHRLRQAGVTGTGADDTRVTQVSAPVNLTTT